MAYWWESDDAERYWIEIRFLSGIGEDLRCPVSSENGSRNPWYDLVAAVIPGDVVFHWNPDEQRFVGRSRVESVPRIEAGERRVDLVDFRPAEAGRDLEFVRSRHSALLDARRLLEEAHPGRALYQPFQFRESELWGLMSNYFVKFPRSMVNILFEPSRTADFLDRPAAAAVRSHWLKPFRPKADEDYFSLVGSSLGRRRREHETLVTDFSQWLNARGFSVGYNVAIDIGLADPAVIVEAKAVRGWPAAIREAVGQLHEYRYFGVVGRNAALIFLASEPVPPRWLEYLESDRRIGVVSRTDEGFELSPLALEYFGLSL